MSAVPRSRLNISTGVGRLYEPVSVEWPPPASGATAISRGCASTITTNITTGTTTTTTTTTTATGSPTCTNVNGSSSSISSNNNNNNNNNNGGSGGNTSSRKTFVTCSSRTSLATNVVLTAIASFLREKVFPIVGEHCRINLHWDGADLSSLHIQSVIPDSYVLVPRKDPAEPAGRTLSAVSTNGNGNTAPSLQGSPSVPPTSKVDAADERGTLQSMDDKSKLGEDRKVATPDLSSGGPFQSKHRPDARIIVTRRENRRCDTPTANGKALPSLRAKPPLLDKKTLPSIIQPVSTLLSPSPQPLHPPVSLTPSSTAMTELTQSICTSQHASMFPLVPLITYVQPHMATLNQLSSTILPSAMSMSQIPLQALQHLVPGYGHVFQQTPSYPVQSVSLTMPHSQTQPPQPILPPTPPEGAAAPPSSVLSSSVTSRFNGSSNCANDCGAAGGGGGAGVESSTVGIGFTGCGTTSQPIKSESVVIPTRGKQVKVISKRYSEQAGQISKLGKMCRAGQLSRLSPLSKPNTIRIGSPSVRKRSLDNYENDTQEIVAVSSRTKSPCLMKVSIVGHGQDEPPVEYPALGSQPLEKLFDTL